MKSTRQKVIFWICLALASVTLLCYWPITRHGFVSVDDPQYVIQNRHVTSGLTWAGMGWAFQSGYACNWHPLTWLTHMADCSLYGLNAGGHHLTNLLLHIADTLLLFLLLMRMTDAPWRSAFVAALFAWHPLHVESVAWASERKDVLSAFFFMLTLLSYVEYVRSRERAKERRSAGASERTSPTRSRDSYALYVLTSLFFACGLMSKPMLVTLPFVLLLLDFWPLQRMETGSQTSNARTLLPLACEKLPFFALALAASVATYFVQDSGGAVGSAQGFPLSMRVANALVSYLRYVEKTFWPANLAEFYPYPNHIPPALTAAAALLLAAGSTLVWRKAKRRPYLAMGWFWYLGMLVPTIGLVQVGPQALADRYMYLPSIGLFLMLVWGVNDLAAWSSQLFGTSPTQERMAHRFLAPIGVAALLGCLTTTWFQSKHWQNGETLFRHALSVTGENGPAWDGLGSALLDMGRREEALGCFSKAERLEPQSAFLEYNLGTVLLELGRPKEAIDHLSIVVATMPRHVHAHLNLGCAFFDLGRLTEAHLHFSKAVALDPGDPQAHYNFGTVLLLQSNIDEAAVELSTAVKLDPGYVSQAVQLNPKDALLRYNLGTILLMQSRVADAVEQLSAAVRLNPKMEEAQRNLAVALIQQGRGPEALAHFSEAARLNPADAEIHFDFGRALLDQDRPAEAVAQLRAGLQLRPDDVNAKCRLAAAQARLH